MDQGGVPVEDDVRVMELHTRHHGKQMRYRQDPMARDERVANRIRPAFGTRNDNTEREMFGGLACLCFGRMSEAKEP